MVLAVTNRIPLIKDVLSKVPFANALFGSWNIYDHKTDNQITSFDTFLGYTYQNNASIPSHPIESGSFSTYNKVLDPARITVVLAKSGFPAEVRYTLEDLERYAQSTDTIDIVLPFRSYLNYNISGISHSIQEGDAVSRLIVELTLTEIKETSLSYTTVRNSASKVSSGNYADTVDKGKKQSQSLAAGLLDKVKGAF